MAVAIGPALYARWIPGRFARVEGMAPARGVCSKLCIPRKGAGASCRAGVSFRAQERMLSIYTAMQNKFAGTKPIWDVCHPMAQMTALLRLAMARPVQCFLPTRTVERIVRQQDK